MSAWVDLPPIAKYRLTEHARDEMARRQISETDVARVLASPGQTQMVRADRAVYQSRLEMSEPPGTYLLRVFVDIDRQPAQVVTAYRTSRIEKYWRVEE
jgi:hypothetical protein